MDILSRPALLADDRLVYGRDPSQFGDFWMPEVKGQRKAPVVVFFHGGWWRSQYDLGYAGYLCAALKREGIACWSVEYRRVGATGGGWPATFQDAAAGFDFLPTLAKTYPLDLSRVLTMGHSAGGHLAFWIAGRHHIDSQSVLFSPGPQMPLRGVISLAGAVDLRLTIDLAGDSNFAHDRNEVYALMGGTPADVPDRYRAANPGDLLPFQVSQSLIQGWDDDQIPSKLPAQWAEKSRRQGEHVDVRMLPGIDHMDVVDPSSRAWGTVRDQVRNLLKA